LLHALQNHHGDYTQAINLSGGRNGNDGGAGAGTLRMRHRLCMPVVKACQAVK
jgi:hypothetical protein